MVNICNDVLKGSNGWLFLYQGGHSQFDYLTGEKKPTENSIVNFYQNIKNRSAYFNAKNIRYKHVVFPSKPLLKDKYLPADLKCSIQSVFERNYLNTIDKITRHSIYYPLDELKKLDKMYSTFRKFDTHMTDRSYLHIATHLLHDINPIISKYPKYIGNQDVKGDLAYMIKSNEQCNEEVIYLDDKNVYRTGNCGFLSSNTNEVVITHSYDHQATERLLIFADSFFQGVLKYLTPFFRDIMFVRSSTMQYDIVELYKPDIVFSGNAERYLSHVQSDGRASAFIFSLYGCKEYNPSEEFLSAYKANLSFNYYPHHHQEWASKYKKYIEPSLKLTNFTLNKDIDRKETSNYLKFDSTGKDPYIIYKNVDFSEGKKYKLDISLVSSVNSTFQVFFTDARVRPLVFQESLSIKKPIKAGQNKLTILLTFPFLGSALRFDPINAIGSVEILEVKLYTVASIT